MFKSIILAFSLFVSSTALAATSVTGSDFFLEDGQAIRANNGNFHVVVFSVVGEHQLLMNGQVVDVKPVLEGAHTTAYYLTNVDRGTHTLTLVTEAGTETITVHVLRVHL